MLFVLMLPFSVHNEIVSAIIFSHLLMVAYFMYLVAIFLNLLFVTKLIAVVLHFTNYCSFPCIHAVN